MKLRHIAACLCGMAMLVGLTLPTMAANQTSQSATVSTTVPASHTVTVTCQGEGALLVDGNPYSSYTFDVPRLKALEITFQIPSGYEVKTVTTAADITLSGNILTLNSVSSDGVVSISFKPIGAPPVKPTPADNSADKPGGGGTGDRDKRVADSVGNIKKSVEAVSDTPEVNDVGSSAQKSREAADTDTYKGTDGFKSDRADGAQVHMFCILGILLLLLLAFLLFLLLRRRKEDEEEDG